MSELHPLHELLPKCKRGILFSGPLVPPVLSGAKTVTRRMDRRWLKYPAGTLLYVCETIVHGVTRPSFYAADRDGVTSLGAWPWQRDVLPSIHMPRALSRCVLRLTEDPRLERIQDITEEEAKREGMLLPAPSLPQCPCEDPNVEDPGPHLPHCLWRQQYVNPDEHPYVAAFVCTWESLHVKPGERWSDNPEVIRIAFERAA